MDPLPLIPENHTNHEAAPILRSALQDTLDGHVFPRRIAENLVINSREEDTPLRNNAKRVLEIHDHAQEIAARTQLAAADIMYQNAMYLIEKEKIDTSIELREKIKLQRCNLFKKLEQEFALEYNLIQAVDLLPNMIQGYLDFRNFDREVCASCEEKVKLKDIKQQKNIQIKRSLQAETVTLIRKKSFQIIPECVSFHNYECNEIYKRNVKLINTSSTTQSIAIAHLPNTPYFTTIILNNQRLAPGMSVILNITFKPKIYRNMEDRVVLKNNEGELAELGLSCTRDLPKLITCLFKSNSNLLDNCQPGSDKFIETRREALNSTIDCGSCLISQYVLVSIVFENKGKDGKFFIMTEDDWFYQNVATVSTCMELFKGDFWIYPTYFEVRNGEIVEISLIFQPAKLGLRVETLYLICDNNAFEQIEVMGDSVEFSKSFIEIDIPPDDTIINKKKDYCVFLGNVKSGSTKTISVVVRNRSYLLLTCEWKFIHKSSGVVERIQETWITQRNYRTKLSQYGCIEYEFKIKFDTEKTGYHNIFFNFYITNIPWISLKENEPFICLDRQDISDKTLSNAVDVLIFEMEVCALIESARPIPTECICQTVPVDHPKQKLFFSTAFIKFGIMPTGLKVQKEFFVRNDSNTNLYWTILEVKYNVDSTPYMDIIDCNRHLSETSGYCPKRKHKKLFYKCVNKKPTSWVSILVLISANSQMETNIEDICLVIYEIIHFDIIIKAKPSRYTLPTLMPMELMYRGISMEIDFTVENRSPITGYFQFFSAIGEDRDRLLVRLRPSSSVIKPLEAIKVTATLTSFEIGFIQNYYIPCFIGLGQELLTLRVLCAVDGPHIIFFLPAERRQLKKVTWPPKLVYEYDMDPWCICNDRECLEWEDYGRFPNSNAPFANLLNPNHTGPYTKSHSNRLHENYGNECKDCSGPEFVESNESTASCDTASDYIRRLEGIISEEFDTDLILHDDVVEVHQVPIMKPTKVSVFVHNITPISTNFTFEPQRFVENKRFDHIAVRLHLKKRDELWNDLIGSKYGILVQPEISSGILDAYESTKIDIWIYANTYGIYSEEIVVDLYEMPAYHFSILIEVVGSPLMLPMALNCITKHPTVRFSTVPFNSPLMRREVKVTNTSSIPVRVLWHSFLKSPNDPDFDPNDAFNVFLQMASEEDSDKVFELVYSMEEYCGRNNSEFCYVEPRETQISAHSSAYIQVVVRPEYFNDQSENINAVGCLVGHLFLKPEYRKKTNFFLRKTHIDINNTKIDVTVTIEKPLLQLEIGSAPFINMSVYANDVLLKRNYKTMKYAVLRNIGASTYSLELSIAQPFFFKNEKGKLKSSLRVYITAYGTVELIICCFLKQEEILALSDLVYENSCLSDKTPFDDRVGQLGAKCQVDFAEKIAILNKSITVAREDGGITQEFPLAVNLYFPRISVDPPVMKFDTVLLKTTYKSMFTIYNHTGCSVKFEIYKSSGATSFLVIPHYGEVPASVGSDLAFFNVFIYFCPNECRKYKESLRVVTNIPNYWTEIQLRGLGSMNAKFAINYKI